MANDTLPQGPSLFALGLTGATPTSGYQGWAAGMIVKPQTNLDSCGLGKNPLPSMIPAVRVGYLGRILADMGCTVQNLNEGFSKVNTPVTQSGRESIFGSGEFIGNGVPRSGGGGGFAQDV